MVARRTSTASDGTAGRCSLELNRLDRVDDPSLRVPHHVSAFAVPHPAHLGQKPFSIFESVELQVDKDKVGIVHVERAHAFEQGMDSRAHLQALCPEGVLKCLVLAGLDTKGQVVQNPLCLLEWE